MYVQGQTRQQLEGKDGRVRWMMRMRSSWPLHKQICSRWVHTEVSLQQAWLIALRQADSRKHVT